ncbi:MAG: hypothetical protein J5J04_10755, partial [Anaerolineae bacterium]|nr:hypothetical protein [Anaerolineae bacterium]
MTYTDRAIAQIKAALDAGPTPGEWFAVNDGTRGEPFMNVKAERISGRGPTHEVAICATGDSPQSMETANARYIAACHPAAIRELLAEIERLRADRSLLLNGMRRAVTAVAAAAELDADFDLDSQALDKLLTRFA